MAELENREPTDIPTLNYLHDAHVLGIEFGQDPEGRRVIRLGTACHPDAEYPPWDGRKVVVILDGVVVARHLIFGHEKETDWVSGWESQISQELKTEIGRLENVGVRCTGIPFDLAFQSGSRLEGLCEGIYVSVGAVARRD
jgi:hypothetical protein